jgi:HK97 family phage prohead protease
MLWQHRPDKIPGVWASMMEDKKGLDCTGRLALNTILGKDVYEIMKLAAELGTFKLSMSIGYDPIEYEIDEKKRVRTLKEVELWETSIVTFPARTGATITTVKSIEDAKTERELENVLRDSGLSRSAAQYLVKLCKPSLRESGGGAGDEACFLSGILDRLKETNKDIDDFIQSVELKSVIPFKSYPLADINSVWNAGAQIKGATVEDLKAMCTWYDSANSDVKSSYKLPHHTQNGYKTVWRACAAAMARLLQKGTKIPSMDRKGCYNHLAKHYKEFEKPVPEFKDYDYSEWSKIFPEYVGMAEILDSLVELNI